MFKAVFTDMDGTLLRKDHTVSKKTKQVIHQLSEKGILIVPISARPLHGMLPITETVFAPHIPVVSLNGSYIWHNNQVIHNISMTIDQAAAIHDLSLHYHVSVMYYSNMEWYCTADAVAIQKEQKITPVAVTIQDFEHTLQHWKEQGISANKILIAGEPKLILKVEEALKQQFAAALNIYKSQPRYVEAMHPDASKTNAMQMIMDMYGLNKEEVIAIGDNYNDVGMIEFAGMGVAMGNAPDDIKAKADYVTASNNEDGVAAALEYFFS